MEKDIHARTNAFEDTMMRLKEVFARCGGMPKELCDLDPKNLEVLSSPKRTVMFTIPFKTKDGVKMIKAYRVLYSDALGPGKGGIRFHPEVELDEVNALAFWMTLKNSLLGLPYGGAKGGIAIDPKQFTEDELEQLSREYIRQLAPFIGERIDVPAPDVYTNPKIMGWMADEYNKIKGEQLFGTFTGKPLSIGGSEGRSYSTAMGGFYVLDEALHKIGLDRHKVTVAIQGFGNAGLNMAEILHKESIKVIAASDSKGGVVDEKGLDIPSLAKHKDKTGSVMGFPGAKTITNDELISLSVDVLIPAALSNAITAKNANDVKAKIILELANGPITHEADNILFDKKIVVLPDILSNAGGVTVSYYEWVQNLTGEYWDEKTVLDKLSKRMKQTFAILHDRYVKPNGMDYRTAAYAHALKRVLQAEKDRGRIR